MPVITPDRVTPELGGPYRDRVTGEVGELVFWEPDPGRSFEAIVRFGRTESWWGKAADFWAKFVHAGARIF